MPEILLHYIWQQRLFAAFPQQTDDGLPVEVLDAGRHNTDAGPDFTNVRLRIGGQELVGNVEIHVRASDWNRHRHHTDPAYDNILLHVVRDDDTRVYNSKGRLVPQCCLQYAGDRDWLARMTEDAGRMDTVAWQMECSRSLMQEPALLTDGWRNTLLRKRLECKKEAIGRLLDMTRGHWEQAFYITLAHNFGFHTNGVPFEQLAIQTPLSCLEKHRSSLFQLTALLLGQSGLLENSGAPDRDMLWNEYLFLKKKFLLTPIDGHLWKRLRMRPKNFPELRIRQFARIIYQSDFLFARLMETRSTAAMKALFAFRDLTDSERHGLMEVLPLGEESVNVLLINTAAPYLYARQHEQRALALLERLPAEKNSIIRQWRSLGQKVVSAADSQALLHLFQYFCQPHKCLNCEVAYRVFLAENGHFLQEK